MYKTLKQDQDGIYSGTCPTCQVPTRVDDQLQVLQQCRHFVRRWRVAADKRVRVEYLSELGTPAFRYGRSK